jgi:chromosome partitioning protein
MRIENSADFETVVGLFFSRKGYKLVKPPKNVRGYDIELQKDGMRIAVQIKNYGARYNIQSLPIQKFLDFINSPLSRFQEGWFITASGFSKPAITEILSEAPLNLRLGVFHLQPESVSWAFPAGESWSEASSPPEKPAEDAEYVPKKKYIGVFTCKGGTGKTTVAAHLAGAFALVGHNVALVDLDPDENLRKLLQDPQDSSSAGLYIERPGKNESGKAVVVFGASQWADVERDQRTKLVICDCSPTLSENLDAAIEKLDYCVAPVNLTPLGVGKNIGVLARTCQHIRQRNKTCKIFIVINNYRDDKLMAGRNEEFFQYLWNGLRPYLRDDGNCRFIHPDTAKIRHSRQLEHWGGHIIYGTKPRLAFQRFGGRCQPREDFLQLVEYLIDHTVIDELRAQGEM